MFGETLIVLFGCLQLAVFDIGLTLIARFGLGVGVGFCMLAKPLYISELAPRDRRGSMVSVTPPKQRRSARPPYTLHLTLTLR